MKWQHDSALLPIDCFAYHFEVKKAAARAPFKKSKQTQLPSLALWQGEKPFASLWWQVSDEGLHFRIEVNKPCEKVSFPYLERGDGIELFLDTRDNKKSKVVSQYCHHFAVLPEAQEGKQVFDITKPHVYHMREKVDTELCVCKTELGNRSYTLELFFPKGMLYGYDVVSFDRLGFTYKIHGLNRPAQYFNLRGDEYNIAHHPHLWGSFLIK